MLEEHDVCHHRSGKPPFSSAYAWTVGQTGKKKYPLIQTKQR